MNDYWTKQHIGHKIKELEIQLADLKAVYEANLLDAAKAKISNSIGTGTTLLDSNASVSTSTTTNTTRAMSMPASIGNAQIAMVTTSAESIPMHTFDTSLNAQYGLKIPKYKSPGDIENFVKRFDEYFLHQEINNHLKANLMLLSLDDKTFDIMIRELNENERQNYNTVKTHLSKRLNVHQTTGHKRLLFRQAKRERNQSLEEYYTNLLGLAAKAFCDEPFVTIDRMIIDQFIAGCEMDKIRLHLIKNSPKTSREAIDMAVNYQAALRYNDLLNNSATKMPTGENKQSKTILRPTTQIEQYKRHCYGKRGSYNFRRSSDAERNNWRTQESKENVFTNTITASSSSFYVTTNISNYKAPILNDTVSTVTLIDKESLKNLQKGDRQRKINTNIKPISLQGENDKEVFNKQTRRPTDKRFLQNRQESYCNSSILTKYSYSVTGTSESRPSMSHIVKKITPVPVVTDQRNRSRTSTTSNAESGIKSEMNAVSKSASSISKQSTDSLQASEMTLLPSSQTSSGASITEGTSNNVKESESTSIKNNELNESISKYLMRLLLIKYSLLLIINSFIAKMTNFEGLTGQRMQSYDLSIGRYS